MWGVDLLNGGWCSLKIQVVHLKESCSVIWEIGTVICVMPVNTAYGTGVVSAQGFVARLGGWIQVDNWDSRVVVKQFHVCL